jgi:hypothetical protein
VADVLYLRPAGNLLARLDAQCERFGSSRNALALSMVEAGLTALEALPDLGPRIAAKITATAEPAKLSEATAPVPEGFDLVGERELRRHFHKYTKWLDGTERYDKGRLYMQAECECGKIIEQPR